MKRALGRFCAILLVAVTGITATSAPAQAGQGWAGAFISYDRGTYILAYTGSASGWGSTSFYLEGWLYAPTGAVEDHVTRGLCTGSCTLRTGGKYCPMPGLWTFHVWAFPTDSTQPAHASHAANVY